MTTEPNKGRSSREARLEAMLGAQRLPKSHARCAKNYSGQTRPFNEVKYERH
ncbi:hypothetical protein D3C75_463610 [compost metagenome]